MKHIFVEKMADGCGNLGVLLSEIQLEQFYQYYELLTERNKVMNLTAITEWEDVIYKHFIDSLSLVKVENLTEALDMHIIDVGTGAGFPGIPLKIAFPGISMTLLDSLNKRVGFLREVIDSLGLSGITAIHGRAEDFGRDKNYREKFDLCVSRAVANIATLAEYCLPFVRVGGRLVAYKSGKVEEELEKGKQAIEILGGEINHLEKFILTGTDAKRDLVVIRKKKSTEKKYPRKAGLPGKEPIG